MLNLQKQRHTTKLRNATTRQEATIPKDNRIRFDREELEELIAIGTPKGRPLPTNQLRHEHKIYKLLMELSSDLDDENLIRYTLAAIREPFRKALRDQINGKFQS